MTISFCRLILGTSDSFKTSILLLFGLHNSEKTRLTGGLRLQADGGGHGQSIIVGMALQLRRLVCLSVTQEYAVSSKCLEQTTLFTSALCGTLSKAALRKLTTHFLALKYNLFIVY